MKKYISILFVGLILICEKSLAQTNEELAKHYLSFEKGTIVKSSSGNCKFDFSYLEKCNVPYDLEMLGVIKDSLDYSNPRIFPIPIVNEGVSLVKYNSSNGIIKKGDPVTSSSIPGEAMKATESGVILGIALEDAHASKGLIKVRLMIQYLK